MAANEQLNKTLYCLPATVEKMFVNPINNTLNKKHCSIDPILFSDIIMFLSLEECSHSHTQT